jgi:hypothetical protein
MRAKKSNPEMMPPGRPMMGSGGMMDMSMMPPAKKVVKRKGKKGKKR